MSEILININSLDEIDKYKKIGISNFLFAVSNFSVGYNSFELDEIPENSYLLINRLLDSAWINELLKLKNKILKFKGIIFEDIGVFQIFKNCDIELIWFQNHFNTNYSSINFWLDNGCESAVIGNEITKDEILEIISKVNKPVILNVLGKNQIMYSRRTLLSNFNKYNNLGNYNHVNLVEDKTKNNFYVEESEFGTVIFNNEYFNYTNLIKEINPDKIKYYLILNKDLSISEIDEILKGKHFGNDGFLNKKTVYKMSEYTDR